MLFGLDAVVLQHVTLRKRWQAARLFIVSIVAAFLIEFEEAVEDDDRACRTHTVGFAIAARDSDLGGGLLDFSRGHLACDGPLPDQIVKCGLVAIEHAANLIGTAVRLGRANGFVGFLGVLGLGLIFPRRRRQIAV